MKTLKCINIKRGYLYRSYIAQTNFFIHQVGDGFNVCCKFRVKRWHDIWNNFWWEFLCLFRAVTFCWSVSFRRFLWFCFVTEYLFPCFLNAFLLFQRNLICNLLHKLFNHVVIEFFDQLLIINVFCYVFYFFTKVFYRNSLARSDFNIPLHTIPEVFKWISSFSDWVNSINYFVDGRYLGVSEVFSEKGGWKL